MSSQWTRNYWLLALTFLAICIAQVEMVKYRGNRKFIIKCCGRKSCSKLPPKKANRTIITQSTKPSLISTSPFSTESSDEIVENSSEGPKTVESKLQPETVIIQSTGTTGTTMETTTWTNVVSTDMLVTNLVTTGSTFATSSLSVLETWTTDTMTTTPSSTTPRPPGMLYSCSDLSCVKNISLFDTYGVLKDARKYGSWREICGELYLFGKSIVTWEENAMRCCAIGMKPLAFETSAKFDCLQNFIKAEVWQYNYNYWTAARQIFANNSFNWCPYETDGSFANLTSMWATDYPGKEGGDLCIHMSVPRNKNLTEITKKNCSNLYMFSCKGMTTPAPRCFAPACPQDKCSKNDDLFSPGIDNVTMFLTNPAQYGLWKSMNFRIFMFSREFKTWDDARRTCCSIGMKLLSLDVAYKYSVLSQIAGEDSATLNANFWTSGTENGCPGAFGWCAENKLVRNAMWARNEPRNGSHCIAATVSSTNTTLMTADCRLALRFICETRDTSNSTSKGEAMKDECATNFNVSIDEQDNIFNSSSFSAKIKCFLKCLGETGGIVLDGHVVDEQLIKLAETLSPNDDAQLKKNLEAVDECSNSKGMDECDTIANVFQCGQEKAPNLVANVINSMEMNSTGVEKSPLQPVLGECIDYECIIDPVYSDLYLNANFSHGTVLTICNKRYLLRNDFLSFGEAASWCCMYGVRIVSIETVEELQCIVNSPLGRFKITKPINCLKYFLGGITRPEKIWTSASRKGTITGFRWCTSRVPLNFSMWKWQPDIEKNPEKPIMTLNLSNTLEDSYFFASSAEGDVALLLCEL
ncbi:uncharacterized protein LOC135942891 [Cloeon dipterum]|uniref:uncharacterized protein LOC135942891 n=1 Tax=Cloeon dipterum TaxID=197152 RepID=UPI0032201523